MTLADSESTVLLQVSGREFAAVIEQFAREPGRIKKPRASLSYVEGQLVIRCCGLTVAVAASGKWFGVVQVPLAFMVTAIRSASLQDLLFVGVRHDRLHIGNCSITCRLLQSKAARLNGVLPAEDAH